MNETVELRITASERAELEAALDQCLREIKQLHIDCERLGEVTDERLSRLRRERERPQAKS